MTQSERPGESFLHLTDFHFWEIVLNPLRLLNKRAIGAMNVLLRRRNEFLMDRAGSYSEYVAARGVRQLLITGDFASTATDKEMSLGAAFVRGLEERGLKPVVIAGNHDVYTFESVRKKRFEKHFGAWLPVAPLPCTHELDGGTPVLFVPTVCPNYITSKGYISDEQVREAAALLDSLVSPVIVAGHYPLLAKTHGYELDANRRLRNVPALREALGRSGRDIVYISGHVHRFSYVQDADYPNLSHLTTGAFFRDAGESGTQGEFCEVHVGGADPSVIRHVNKGDWQAIEEKKRSDSG